jgi:hypothetical protein
VVLPFWLTVWRVAVVAGTPDPMGLPFTYRLVVETVVAPTQLEVVPWKMALVLETVVAKTLVVVTVPASSPSQRRAEVPSRYVRSWDGTMSEETRAFRVRVSWDALSPKTTFPWVVRLPVVVVWPALETVKTYWVEVLREFVPRRR